jgi:hypothetical protein
MESDRAPSANALCLAQALRKEMKTATNRVRKHWIAFIGFTLMFMICNCVILFGQTPFLSSGKSCHLKKESDALQIQRPESAIRFVLNRGIVASAHDSSLHVF